MNVRPDDTIAGLTPGDTLTLLTRDMTRGEAHQLMNRAARSGEPESFSTAELTAHRQGDGSVRYDYRDLAAEAIDWLLAVRKYGLAIANEMFQGT